MSRECGCNEERGSVWGEIGIGGIAEEDWLGVLKISRYKYLLYDRDSPCVCGIAGRFEGMYDYV